MFPLICSGCKNYLEFDYQASLEEFLSKVSYTKDSIDKICNVSLETPLMYKCVKCGSKVNYNFREVEEKFKETLCKDIKKYRKIYVFRNVLNPNNINPDNGLTYCGICDGVDDEGNCYVDIYKICPLVKNDL